MKLSSLVIFIFIYSCNNIKHKNDFNKRIKSLQSNIDTTKTILFLQYTPYACVSCNAMVNNIYNSNEIKSNFGNNICWIFNSIRKSELDDYKKDFKNHISSNTIITCNESIIYNKIISNIPKTDSIDVNDAICIIYKPDQDKFTGISMRNFDIVSKIIEKMK